MRKKKRTTVRQTVMQIVIGSKPPSELLEDVLDTCTEWYTAAGGWILALMLVGPFVWVGWCALALNYLEFIGAYYPMLLDNWLWLCLVVGFFSVPILATFSYLDKKTQFIAILLEEEVPAKIPGSDKVELKEEKKDMEKVVSKSDESLRIESVQDVNDWPEDFGRVAPQLQDKVTGEYSTKPERMRVEHDQVFSATGYQWRQKPEQLVMEKDVKPIVNEKQHKLQEEEQEADVLGPDTRSPFLMMSEEQKRMARLRAFGLVHSILVLAFVWIITEVYMRVNYDIDFHTIRSYGLWLASGFRGLLLFAFTTTMTGFAIVASRFFMKKSKSKRRVRRPLPPSPQVSDAESHSTQVPAIDETLDKITPKGSGKGKDEGREALFWMVCVGLNLCTVQGLAALLFYTPVWARSLIGPA